MKKWVAGLIGLCLLIWIWPSQAMERYLTKNQRARVERLVASKDYVHGLSVLDELREGREGDYMYWMFRGICNAGMENKGQEAETDLLRALSLCREQYEIYEVKYYLASLCNQLGRYEETREICLEALSLVRRWKPGARERYEALLNRSDIAQESQKITELQQRGDGLTGTPDVKKDTVILPVPLLEVEEDTVLLAKNEAKEEIVGQVEQKKVKEELVEQEDLAELEASAREMIKEMEQQGKSVKNIADLLPPYQEMKEKKEKVKSPPLAPKKEETPLEKARWKDLKLIIGKDTLLIVQGNDSLVAVVKRIAKVQREEDGGLVYVIPADWAIEADGLEKLLDKRVTVLVYEVFDFNKVYMNGRGHLFMDKMCTMLDGRPDMQLEISVHCDGIGTREVNQRVAEMRMIGIHDRLEKKNLPVGRIHFEVCGSARPRQITVREAELYPFLKVGDVLTMEYLSKLTVEQRRIGHMLNRRVEIRKIN